jgi:tetratricopeptide (TPR) repeat protein
MQLVHDGLDSENVGKWLLILDNADDASMYYSAKSDFGGDPMDKKRSYARYMPKSRKGSVLVTTRDKRLGERLAGRQRPVEITPMTEDESKELLKSKIAEEDWCEEDAVKLVAELSYLPLAITQAAAFISENSLTVSEYLDTLHAGDDDVKELLSSHLEDPRREWDTENSVMRTWKLSFDQISKDCPRAAEMLSLMSVLDYHSVPLVLVRKEKETETSFRTALGTLQAFSLVTVGRGKQAVAKMHRLVALSTQKWIEMQGHLARWQSEAVNLLTAAFPGPGQQSHAQWGLYEALTPHSLLAFDFPLTEKEDLIQCSKLMVAVTLYGLSKGRYGQAYKLCSRSLEIRESVLPPDDPLTLDSVQTFGETLLHRADFPEALKMLERAVVGRGKVLGINDPDTLESLSDMTITLLELDELDTAEKTAARALNGRREILGEDDLDYLVSLNLMAVLRHRQGADLDAAQELYETVLARREAKLGAQHPDTLMTRNNLSRLLYERGELDAARHELEDVVAGEEKVLGAEGYDVQVSLSNLALVHDAQGDPERAEELLKRVLGIREKLLGPEHPSTLFTMEMLAENLGRREMNREAERLRVLVTRRKEKRQRLGGGSVETGALLRAGLLFD